MKLFIPLLLFAIGLCSCDNRGALSGKNGSSRSSTIDDRSAVEQIGPLKGKPDNLVRSNRGPPPPPPPHRRVTAGTFSADGRLLLLGYRSWGQEPDTKNVVLWDVATGKKIRGFDGFQTGIGSICFLASGDRALVSDYYGRVILYEVPSGKQVWFKEVPEKPMYPLFVSGDEKYVVSPGGELWNVADGQVIRRLSLVWGKDFVRALTPDGKLAFVGGSFERPAEIPLRLWNVTEDGAIREFKYSEGWRLPVAFSPDSRFAVVGKAVDEKSENRDLVLWDLAADKPGLTFMGWGLGVTFTPDGKGLFTSFCYHDAITRWDVETGRVVNSFQLNMDLGSVGIRAVSWDGKLACISIQRAFPAMDKKIEVGLWDVVNKQMLRTLEVIENR